MIGRRSGRGYTSSIWTGFVDVMTALLLVLIFLISVFLLFQFVLSSRSEQQQGSIQSLQSSLAERDALLEEQLSSNRTLQSELEILNVQVADLRSMLDSERQSAQQVGQNLSVQLEENKLLLAELETVRGELESRDAQVEQLDFQLAQASEGARQTAEELADARSQLVASNEALKAKSAEASASARQIEDLESTIAELNLQVQEVRVQIGTLSAELADERLERE